MSLKATSRRIAQWVAIASVLTAATTLALSGTANAATSAPPPASTGGFGLVLINNPDNAGGRQFEVCNFTSTARRIFVQVQDLDDYGARLMIADTVTNNETYGQYVNFNPNGCEDWWIVNGGTHTVDGIIQIPDWHETGAVRYN